MLLLSQISNDRCSGFHLKKYGFVKAADGAAIPNIIHEFSKDLINADLSNQTLA